MVTVEWKLHPEEVESDVCRSRFQLFSLAGGASRTDLRGSVTYPVRSLLHGQVELEMIYHKLIKHYSDCGHHLEGDVLYLFIYFTSGCRHRL